ncbi:zinc-binding dehydrogenase [Streptomyces sp. 7N604]|uniref:zinc-binding dehydrogenase n=1 Tax=Streptomyces sp. 7N604 TaxID=3457415 RepID=UPI003FD5DE66
MCCCVHGSNVTHRSLPLGGRDVVEVVLHPGAQPSQGHGERARGLRASAFLVEPDGAALARIAELIDAGAVGAEVEDVLPLDRAAEAHRRGEDGGTRGKLVLTVTPPRNQPATARQFLPCPAPSRNRGLRPWARGLGPNPSPEMARRPRTPPQAS